MKALKSFLFSVFIFCLAWKANGQTTYTQSYVDKCSGELKLVNTTFVNGNAVVSFYNQIKVFTPLEVQSGIVQTWLNGVYAAYSAMGCPTNVVVQQTVNQTVNQATSQAASAAASTASSAASSAASSSASSAASSSASSAASSTTSAPPPTSSSPPSGGSSTASSSGSSSTSSGSSSSSSGGSSSGGGNSSSEQKSETKSETKSENKSESKEESKSDNKSEEKKEESKSEEKKEEKSEESKEEKKDDKKKEKKASTNPMLLSSDLAGVEDAEGRYAAMMSLGISKSSLMGDKSFSLNALVWSTLDQFALSGGMTKMNFQDGKLNSIHSYSLTAAYLKGTLMQMLGYTNIKPHPKYGTYGYNVGILSLQIKNPTTSKYNNTLMTSFVAFWTKPYQYTKKITISPQIFFMNSPISWNTLTGNTLVTRVPGFIIGSGFDYRISKRFAFSSSYKVIISLEPKFNLMNNFQIGSKMVF